MRTSRPAKTPTHTLPLRLRSRRNPCTKIAETDIHFNNWNGTTANWVYHEITVGSVTRSIAAGRELRLRLLNGHNDLWIPLTPPTRAVF